MSNKSNRYTTAHEFARELLAGPDNIIVMILPTFDSPGAGVAFPVVSRPERVADKDIVEIIPNPLCFAEELAADLVANGTEVPTGANGFNDGGEPPPGNGPVDVEEVKPSEAAGCGEHKCGCGHKH